MLSFLACAVESDTLLCVPAGYVSVVQSEGDSTLSGIAVTCQSRCALGIVSLKEKKSHTARGQ